MYLLIIRSFSFSIFFDRSCVGFYTLYFSKNLLISSKLLNKKLLLIIVSYHSFHVFRSVVITLLLILIICIFFFFMMRVNWLLIYIFSKSQTFTLLIFSNFFFNLAGVWIFVFLISFALLPCSSFFAFFHYYLKAFDFRPFTFSNKSMHNYKFPSNHYYSHNLQMFKTFLSILLICTLMLWWSGDMFSMVLIWFNLWVFFYDLEGNLSRGKAYAHEIHICSVVVECSLL